MHTSRCDCGIRNRDRNVLQYSVHNADELYVPHACLDIRKFSLKISGAKLWNVLPNYIKESSSVDVFKKNLLTCVVTKKESIVESELNMNDGTYTPSQVSVSIVYFVCVMVFLE